MNNNEVKTKIEELKNALTIEARELLEYPRELTEHCHEQADSDMNVIYYARAHELIRNTNAILRDEAESMLYDTCGTDDRPDYDTLATRIAYWIVYLQTERALREELEAYREKLEELEELEEPEGTDTDEALVSAEFDALDEIGI